MKLNKSIKIFIGTLAVILVIKIPSTAKVVMPAIFSDNMVLQRDAEVPIWGWSESNRAVSISVPWLKEEIKTKSDSNGKWKAWVKTPMSGGPFTLSFDDGDKFEIKDVLIGEVWLCSGQSNMEMPMKGYTSQPVEGANEDLLTSDNQSIRLIKVPRNASLEPLENFEGRWEKSTSKTVSEFSAVAWYFANYLNKSLNVPVGVIVSAYGGSNIQSWMSKQMLSDFNEISIPESMEGIKTPNRKATLLYNAMLRPIIGYGIRGVLWYQGESNVVNPSNYEDLMVQLVKSWRKEWEQEKLDFYYTQIAPYSYKRYIYGKLVGERNGAYLREAQLKASYRIPNSGMAVLMDIGEEKNIHPKKKKEVGLRLAYQALAKTYNLQGFEHSSPIPSNLSQSGNELIVEFENVPNGLIVKKHVDNEASFFISSNDSIFYKSNARVKGNKLFLSCDEVDNPIAVHYGFENYKMGILFSSGGLPVSSFRMNAWK
ncbi:sialate O-acetylesterase [Echinicola strongylocentroti]|uniref:Sialate O-acetylesterase n=1 Tax=Echinicola strongylocentroti TaxID=1795355 RepID=A0A2Z4ID95_9BACT|nr:sialate O-acetylesterase [Echinicola strongylocentroti]AWW28834.1 sialate O-acetylesterase [Echinicola strongylocentroti]